MDNIIEFSIEKQPKPPRKICSNYLNYFFGIVSPALTLKYSINYDEQVCEYFKNLRRYRLYKRTLTRLGYKQLRKDFIEYNEKTNNSTSI